MTRALILLACLTATAAAAPAVTISTKTKTVEVKDEALGIVAFTMEVPANWTFEGVMLRDGRCGLLPTVAYRLSSPDGLAGVQVLPQFGSHWADDAGTLAARASKTPSWTASASSVIPGGRRTRLVA